MEHVRVANPLFLRLIHIVDWTVPVVGASSAGAAIYAFLSQQDALATGVLITSVATALIAAYRGWRQTRRAEDIADEAAHRDSLLAALADAKADRTQLQARLDHITEQLTKIACPIAMAQGGDPPCESNGPNSDRPKGVL